MSKKMNLMLGFASSAIILSACGGMTVEDVKESTDSIQNSFEDVLQTHEELVQLEGNMNEQFENVLSQDEELATIRDESADVVQNINERQTVLENLNDPIAEINEQIEVLNAYEGDELSNENLKSITENFTQFTNELADFSAEYEQSLSIQQDYLTQIATDEANYEDFASGLEGVNTNYSTLQETTISFDENLSAFHSELMTLQKEVNSLLSKEEVTDQETEVSTKEADQESEEDTEKPNEVETTYLTVQLESILRIPDSFPKKFVYDSGRDFPYPEDGVKGVFSTAHSAGGSRLESLTELINTTELNAMVIDIKDDHGNVTLDIDSDNELIEQMTNNIISDPEALMDHLEENDIYPIARIVVFKDSILAQEKPEWSFTNDNGEVWVNRRGESFVNPYLKEVWDYNIEVAIEAAKLGFKDIQFDYVRFPEGFETRDRELNYSHGHYGSDSEDVISMEYRNQAVTDFVAYAREQLQPYGADLSVDIFGYAAVVRETPGIGQSFPAIAKEVDVISSMIYPSHWGLGNLDVAIPDLDPYQVVYNYSIIENEIMEELGEDAPISRPWIQDFTASYLGAGYYKTYGAQEVSEQVRALNENGITEFLLWNAGNRYSEGATYSFEQ